MPEKITIGDYYDMLERLDWTYLMSDDHAVYKRGEAAMNIAISHVKESEEHRKLFNAYYDYAWRKTSEKPQRPKIAGFRTGEENGPKD